MELNLLMIFLTGAFAWFTANLSGGSGSLIFLPLSFLFLPASAITQATAFAMLFSDTFYVLTHGQNADPAKLKKSLPIVAVCALSGAWLYSITEIRIYSFLLLLFYLSHLALGFRWGRNSLPSYLLTGFFGIDPLPPAKAVDDKGTFYTLKFVCLMTVVSGYIIFGVIDRDIFLSGAAGGIGAAAGGFIGKLFSTASPDRVFRTVINTVLIICVCIIAAGQL